MDEQELLAIPELHRRADEAERALMWQQLTPGALSPEAEDAEKALAEQPSELEFLSEDDRTS